jgi:hypothetical protein
MNPEIPETARPKYFLPKENILPQDRLPVPELISKKWADLGWPLEMQGTGKTDKKTGELKIWYPKGDVFFSFATLIHELGHWRQEEIDEDLNKRKELFPDSDATDLNTNEQRAYKRGSLRVKKYAPELLQELEAKLQQHRGTGKLNNFNNFEQLLEWHKNFGLAVADSFVGAPDTEDKEKYENYVLEKLKALGMEKRFKEFASLRVGETIDTEYAEKVLMEIANGTANE